nr:PREDICTED: ribonuclease P protein subunit p14 [Apteryx mantelli mantelli]
MGGRSELGAGGARACGGRTSACSSPAVNPLPALQAAFEPGSSRSWSCRLCASFCNRVGAALPVDVLTYEEKTLSAILRVTSSGLVKLWSALTLLGFYQNRRCAFRVLQTSPFLLALSGNSRELVLD